ncbi:Uncharacterised protein [Bordetella pertussis]|nr:Uncharacterised protein [Bordetella pertussis]
MTSGGSTSTPLSWASRTKICTLSVSSMSDDSVAARNSVGW